MSMKLMALAMSAKVGNPAKKLVLLKLCDNANDKGECWPSLQNIADQCEISRRTAISHVQSLAEDGFLIIENRFKNNEQISNFYIIDLEQKAKSIAIGSEKIAPPPSEKSALPPSEKIAPPSAEISPPSEKIAPPPSEKSAHRTSHSLEPVNELVNKHYPDWFLDLISRYPPRSGSNDKRRAFIAVKARLAEGKTIEQINSAVDRYKAFVIANGNINTQFTMQAATFFGPGEHIDNPWVIGNSVVPNFRMNSNDTRSRTLAQDLTDKSWVDQSTKTRTLSDRLNDTEWAR